MDTHKINNYERLHGPGSFPQYHALSSSEVLILNQRLARLLRMPSSVSGQDLAVAIRDLPAMTSDQSACENEFALRDVFDAFTITPKREAYVNWYHFDTIDRMSTLDLFHHFSDLWYPSADDIDVFDDSLDWILTITHYGSIELRRLNTPQ